MQHGTRPDSDILADADRRSAVRIFTIAGYAQPRAFLDIAARAYRNSAHIAANDGVRPHKNIVSKIDIADDLRRWINVYALTPKRLATRK